MDHDQRFKLLIQEFFGDFLDLFFHQWAERLDTSQVEWLDKEVFLDPPQGEKGVLDLVAKLPTRQVVPVRRVVLTQQVGPVRRAVPTRQVLPTQHFVHRQLAMGSTRPAISLPPPR